MGECLDCPLCQAVNIGVDHQNTHWWVIFKGGSPESSLMCPRNGVLFRMIYSSWCFSVIWVASGRKSRHRMNLKDKNRQMSINAEISQVSQFILRRFSGAYPGKLYSLMPTVTEDWLVEICELSAPCWGLCMPFPASISLEKEENKITEVEGSLEINSGV